MLSKKLSVINWLTKSILLILRYQALVDLSLKHSITPKNNVLNKGLRILTEIYPILVGWPRRMIKKQKLVTWKQDT